MLLPSTKVYSLSPSASLLEKVKFINTCDALLHARHRGETFGLTIAEFMSKNKPIFTYSGSAEKNHYLLLDNQGILYDSSDDLYCKISQFVRSDFKTLPNQHWPEQWALITSSIFEL